MRIAIVSDLHIGTKARGLDMCPHVVEKDKKANFHTDYLSYFIKFVSSSAFSTLGPIDMLCVTGDISNTAAPSEFILAHEVIQKIADAIKVPLERVYYVPGNHDVHWAVSNLDPSDFWKRYRYEPLMQPGLVFGTQLTNSKTGAFNADPHFVVWSEKQYLVVGFNSAAYDAPKPDDDEHHGLIHPDTLAELDAFLTNSGFDSDIPRICLVHHHPIQYSDPTPAQADFSALTNAGDFLELLSKHKFDLIFHGHKHVPHLQRCSGAPNGHPITVLGAGSFSAQLDSRWIGTIANQFHVVNVEGRDKGNGALYGHISNWVFDTAGTWKVSHSQTGLCATEAFGSLVTSTELETEISSHVDAFLAKHQSCTWEDLVAASPSLRHANTTNAHEALQRVATSKRLKLLGEVDTNRTNWTLLPPRK